MIADIRNKNIVSARKIIYAKLSKEYRFREGVGVVGDGRLAEGYCFIYMFNANTKY